MTPLDTALRYASRGWPVFPCSSKKLPLTPHGFRDATTDQEQIRTWWSASPFALIGVPTGEQIGAVVLDVDLKNGNDGFRTLAELGLATLPETPTVRTRTGGAHLYFEQPDFVLRNTTGERGRGIGPGLDWRGTGGYVIVPSPGSGYVWDRWHFGNCVPLPAPAQLLPREARSPTTNAKPIEAIDGLDRYAERALDSACQRILAAPKGEQRNTVNSEAFSIGRLAGAGAIPPGFARDVLLWAARQIPDYDPKRPWRPQQIEAIVTRAFDDGLARPRNARHG